MMETANLMETSMMETARLANLMQSVCERIGMPVTFDVTEFVGGLYERGIINREQLERVNQIIFAEGLQ